VIRILKQRNQTRIKRVVQEKQTIGNKRLFLSFSGQEQTPWICEWPAAPARRQHLQLPGRILHQDSIQPGDRRTRHCPPAEKGEAMETWTEAEEKIIAQIMASETMHDPENATGDIRIQCTRSEALRRLQRRKVCGAYREPSKSWVLTDIHLPVTLRVIRTPEEIARFKAMTERRRAA